MIDRVDELAMTTRPEDAPRKTWETPVLSVVSVDEAESGAAPNPDGGDFS